MTLAICLMMLFVDSLLALNTGESSILNQKIASSWAAQDVALSSAEAGLVATEAQLNHQSVDLSMIKGQITNYVSAETIDQCEQHLLTVVSKVNYQNAQINLIGEYLQAHQPPIENCQLNQPSHWVWWMQADN